MGASTHEVINQVPPLGAWNPLTTDPTLTEAAMRLGLTDLSEFAAAVGSEQFETWAVQANRFPPELHTHDASGHRIDHIEYHPAWHSLMGTSVKEGLHSSPWENGRHATRAARFYMMAQIELGHLCPISMTYSAMPLVRLSPELAGAWEGPLSSKEYDPRPLPYPAKAGVLIGMAMTEKQGGSDLRANTSRAEPNADGEYLITGHKWFCSAPMSDAFFILAQAEGRLSCFLLPRLRPDGTSNGFHIQRLKDKLGNRSNASGEIEFSSSMAWLVGEEGQGVRTIMDMVNLTRLDCTIAAAALMRRGLVQAAHHSTHRQAFGKQLSDQPLMRNVLADLALESVAATTLMLRIASAFDSDHDPVDSALRRVGTAVAKYWLCKRVPGHAAEALECLGGNGYVEESIMPRVYREAPLYGIWEGSGNVIALDVLRALTRDPTAGEAILEDLRMSAGTDVRFDAALAELEKDLAQPTEDMARVMVERLATTLQAALLLRHAPGPVADAFCHTRLTGVRGQYGILPNSANLPVLLDTALA